VLAIVVIIGTMGYNMAIQRIDMIVLNITGKLTFLTSISLGILLLKEKIDTKKAVGMLFILASLILANS
jgi:drug/metabolite transporter (DMT)-like permease